MNKKTMIALAVAGAMGTLVAGGVSAETITIVDSIGNFDGVSNVDQLNQTKLNEDLTIEQTGSQDGAAIGRTDADLHYKNISIKAAGIGVFAYESYANPGQPSNHRLVAEDTLSIVSTGNDAVMSGNGLITLQGKTVSIESKADGNALKTVSAGRINVKGTDVTIKSDKRGAIANVSSTDAGAANKEIVIEATNSLKIVSTIDNSGSELRYNNAVSVNQGTVTLDAPNIDIIVDNVAGKAGVNAIAMDNGNFNLKAGTANVNGDINTTGGMFNLDGTLVFNGDNAKIENLGGNNGTFMVTKESQTVAITNNTNDNLTVAGSGDLNDKFGGDISKLENMVTGADGATLTLKEGMYSGEVVKNGNDISRAVNSVVRDTLKMASATTLAFDRQLMNDVRKRLGDLRYTDAQNGAWVRYDGGRMSATGVSNKFNTLQMGYDTVAFADNVRVGASVSYTRGDAEITRGGSDMDAYSLALYGTWMGDNGMFADVIARAATIKNDMTVDAYTGDIDNKAYSLSGEFGQRFDIAKNFFVEPQVEVTYTYVDSDTLRLDTRSYKFDSTDSLIGRAGMVAGWTCPNQKGQVYVRASAVHQFKGDAKATMGDGSTYEEDGKDTWAELGLGVQYNVNKNAYIWADVERTQGANITEDFRGTLGVRFNF